MKIDLHNHSNYSDGIYSPKEVIEFAVKNGVDYFALTDHDSVFGLEEIQKEAKNYPVRIINGLELSTEYKDKSVHIVCLFKHNIIPKEMIDFSQEMEKKRRQRAIDMMTRVKKYYQLKVDIDELLKSSKVITRGNMMYHIAKMNHLPEEKASVYVGTKSKAYIPSTRLKTKEGIAFAKACGCLTILAHPCLLPKEYVEEIVELGVDGIEVRYPKNKEGDEAYFTALAKKKNLLISAGSDFHGDTIKHAMMGTCTLSYEEFEEIEKRLDITW